MRSIIKTVKSIEKWNQGEIAASKTLKSAISSPGSNFGALDRVFGARPSLALVGISSSKFLDSDDNNNLNEDNRCGHPYLISEN